MDLGDARRRWDLPCCLGSSASTSDWSHLTLRGSSPDGGAGSTARASPNSSSTACGSPPRRRRAWRGDEVHQWAAPLPDVYLGDADAVGSGSDPRARSRSANRRRRFVGDRRSVPHPPTRSKPGGQSISGVGARRYVAGLRGSGRTRRASWRTRVPCADRRRRRCREGRARR